MAAGRRRSGAIGQKMLRARQRRPSGCGWGSGAVQAQPPAHFVLVYDCVGVTMGDAGVVRQPVRAFLAAQERGARFKTAEPLSKVAPGNDRDASDKTTVQMR
jgi:hypothetical protein